MQILMKIYIFMNVTKLTNVEIWFMHYNACKNYIYTSLFSDEAFFSIGFTLHLHITKFS